MAHNLFHMSLNVSNLDRSVEFFTRMLGVEPAKCRPDYAKFETADPPLVLSLEPHGHASDGALNHVGFRFPDAATLVDYQRRLELNGISTQREDNVECCYAKQSKFWVRDPDNTLWEFYVLESDIDHRGVGQKLEEIAPRHAPIAATAIWEHRLGQPLPLPLPHENHSLDEVRMRGSFNIPIDVTPASVFADVRRVLRANGRLQLHLLTSDRPVADSDVKLTGAAAHVRRTPALSDLMRDLTQAGFVNVKFEKYAAAPCFRIGDAALRETLLTAISPSRPAATLQGSVQQKAFYRGPFAQVTDEFGTTYPCGQFVPIRDEQAQALLDGPLAEHFMICSGGAQSAACSAS